MALEDALAQRARNGTPGTLEANLIAQGEGWTVEDVLCTSDRRDRTFEERHAWYRVVIIAAGSFQYRSETGRELMTPGSLLLGNTGECFECGHDHAAGDRCVAFGFAPEFFDRLWREAREANAYARPRFTHARVPPLRALSTTIASACTALTEGERQDANWEELALKLAAQTVQLTTGEPPPRPAIPPSTEARVTRAARLIDRDCSAALSLATLAREARLSPYHFLRTFEHLTGLTPHQYVRRARLREAAQRLATEPIKIVDIALESGFGDVSTFNRAFRTEFGMNPQAYRLRMR
jgi:AraC family transcriptional regulator